MDHFENLRWLSDIAPIPSRRTIDYVSRRMRRELKKIGEILNFVVARKQDYYMVGFPIHSQEKNIDQLLRIYDEHKEETGALGFKCDRKNNNMDVFFMNEELIIKLIKEDIWNQIKGEHEGKKIFIIQLFGVSQLCKGYTNIGKEIWPSC